MMINQTTVHISLPNQLCQRAKNTRTGKTSLCSSIASGCAGPDISSACGKVDLYMMGHPKMSRLQKQPDQTDLATRPLGSAKHLSDAVCRGPLCSSVERFLVAAPMKRKRFFPLFFLFFPGNRKNGRISTVSGHDRSQNTGRFYENMAASLPIIIYTGKRNRDGRHEHRLVSSVGWKFLVTTEDQCVPCPN